MQILIQCYVFVLGAIFGSFALVLADRTKAKKQWVRGRSACEYCKHTLSATDLIPIASWVFSGARCRYCKKPLSVFYPLTELGLGLAFLGSYLFWDFNHGVWSVTSFALWLIALVIAAALFVYDARWYLLPASMLYALIGVSGLYRIMQFFIIDATITSQLISISASLVVASGIFWVLYRVSSGAWIGDGDITLGIAIGLLTGGPLLSWFSIVIASAIGLLYALPQVATSKGKKKKLHLKVPFGPFLLIGMYITILFGQQVVDWYQRTFLYM